LISRALPFWNGLFKLVQVREKDCPAKIIPSSVNHFLGYAFIMDKKTYIKKG
jgi:hypothetical protein